MIVLGVDLSGPTKPEHSALAIARAPSPAEGTAGEAADDALVLERLGLGAHDQAILEAARAALSDARPEAEGGELIVGLDAPLSYNAGGGDRPVDRRLRRAAIEAGLASGTVMAPTMTRMAYLTLRGLAVARLLEPLGARIVEVHPGVALALRGAPVDDVRALKTSAAARQRLLAFLEQRGLCGAALESSRDVSDHEVAACAAALAAHRWARHRAVWLETARPPHHPYDVAC